MNGRLVGALVVALCCVPAHSSAQTVAVVVGNNVPPAGPAGEGLATLRYADDDAYRYAQLLRRVADRTVVLAVYDRETRSRAGDAVVDGPPTLAALRKRINALRWEDELTLVLVFTGHGAVDEAGAPFLSLLDGPLTRRVLFEELLAPLAADRVHLIIDACHAAGVVGIRGDRFAKEIDGKTVPVNAEDDARWAREQTLDRFPHVGVLASSSFGESSHEWSVLESGVFSHEVLSGLWGAADINEDRVIEYSEIQSFVAAANRAVKDPRAKPSVVVHPPAVDPHTPLVDLRVLRESAFLEGDVSDLGRFYVELGDGRRHLDGHLDGVAVLAVPPGEGFLRAGDVEYPFVARAGERIQFADLEGRPVESAARGSASSAFRRRLFAEPYNYDYYSGYVDSVGGVAVTPPTRVRIEVGADDIPRRPVSPAVRGGGIALVSVAAVTGAAALGLGLSAAVLRARFSDAETERDAERYVGPHRRQSTAAIGLAVTSAVTGVAGAVMLRRARSGRR